MAEFFTVEAPALIGQIDFAEALVPLLAKWKSKNGVPAILEHWHAIDVDRPILELIAELRRSGVYCALASNQEAHRAGHMSAQLAYRDLFDREFYSCHLGHTKPSAAYFTEIIRLAGLDPTSTLFIDDRAENVEGARHAGLHAAQFVLGEIGTGGEPMRRLLQTYGLFAEG